MKFKVGDIVSTLEFDTPNPNRVGLILSTTWPLYSDNSSSEVSTTEEGCTIMWFRFNGNPSGDLRIYSYRNWFLESYCVKVA